MRFVIGDIHGRIEALKEVLKKSKFDYDQDHLIILGDVCDGGYNTYECVEELLKIKNRTFIMGNHDEWFLNNIKSGWAENIWLHQGGQNTIDSYKDKLIPVTHQDFFSKAKYYHIEDNMVFVHGGFRPEIGVNNEEKNTLLWDRDLLHDAMHNTIPKWDKIFVGHTTTQMFFKEIKPYKLNNLWMMDCGAGWTGKLCIMNIDSEEYWLSKKQDPAN